MNRRLQAIERMILPGPGMIDVGTDHGYLPVSLAQRGYTGFLCASDINEGPLEKAEENAALYGAGASVELRLGPGLSTLQPDEAECAVITGMGHSPFRP